MSFIQNEALKPSYAPGWFLADDEACTRITATIPATGEHVTTNADGTKYCKMGTFISQDGLKGILYEDVDLSTGDMPGSVVVAGRFYHDRVHGIVSGNDALIDAGTAPTVTRPGADEDEGEGGDGDGEGG